MRRSLLLKWAWGAFALVAGVAGCTDEDTPTTDTPAVFPRYDTLSEYPFFTGELKALQPAEGVLPYSLNTELFTDYAFKARFVYLPEGKAAAYSSDEVLDFPVGTVLIKNFYYPLDFRNPEGERRIIETRLLVHTETGWENRDYRWNAAQTEATLDRLGGLVDVNWTHYDGSLRSTQYFIPNETQCASCHLRGGSITPIGPAARHLNRDYPYADGPRNQLEKWAEEGLLTGSPGAAAAPRNAQAFDPATGTLDARTRAYLDINCGHCHRPDGPANNTGLHLYASATTPEELGICKRPIAAGQGSGGLSFDVKPGQPDSSILYYRMNSNNPGIMMPEIGRTVIHEEGLALVREWIQNLPPGPCN